MVYYRAIKDRVMKPMIRYKRIAALQVLRLGKLMLNGYCSMVMMSEILNWDSGFNDNDGKKSWMSGQRSPQPTLDKSSTI